MKSTLMAFPQGKTQDEFLGCRRLERLQPARTTAKNKKGFLGTLYPYKECLARIAPCQKSHQTQARHTSASPESSALKTELAAWIPGCRENDGVKMHIDGTPPGKNSGRIFRLSAPGAPTTGPDNGKEQKGLSGHSLAR
ncbi:hypothetical protein Q4491_19785 [Photobacterium sp. 2_MG-2023]|uniref:hypothetical protein n=1 Tax=Photobacterium sp. 2_MG-2023 TaxID=3062663 RepID=UPI0026E39A1F|nr:hypothetical protein [Photobacterium sp. 2_MG-2023]MDO6583586.1 hypothetical protein [Photobacterium sp. 2_MG-2023]